MSRLTIIPLIFTCLQSTSIWKKLNSKFGENIIYFIIKESVKNFISIFFITIIFFLIVIELKNIIHLKRKKQMRYLDFDEENYVYSNSRNKKGCEFIKSYIKDILILMKSKLLCIWQGIYMSTFIFVYRVFIKLIGRLTNNFSLYVIVMKTFSISIIATLLITYYKLLLIGGNDIIVDFYSVIITAIIIPIILNIISDLKNSNI